MAGTDPEEGVDVVLPNGLQVVVELSPHQEYAVVGYWLQVGSADDPVDRSGLTHFSEHMISPHALAQRAGARLVAVETSLDYTGALFTVASHDLASFLPVQAQRYHQAAWDSSAFEFARNGVVRELEFRDRNPIVTLQTQLLAEYFHEHAYARPVVGSRSCVQAIELADVTRLIERQYRSRRALLFVRGPYSPDDVLEWVSEAHAVSGRTPIEAPPTTRTDAARRTDVRLEQSHSANAYVVIGFPTPPAAEGDYLLFLAALNRLFGVSALGAHGGVGAPGGWLERVTNIAETVDRIEVSLSPAKERFVALAGFQLRSGVDPASFADRVLDAIARFPRCLSAMAPMREPGNALSETWNLANAASPSPSWFGAVHRLMGAPEPLLRLADHRPQISPELVARFVDSTWIPSDCPVGILASQTSARASIVCAPVSLSGDSMGDDAAVVEGPQPPRAQAGRAALIERRRSGMLFRYLSSPVSRIAAASVTVPVANPSAMTHAVLTVFAASLQKHLHGVLCQRGARFAQRAFSLAAVPAYDHLSLELSAVAEIFHPMLAEVVSMCRRELPGISEFEGARGNALDGTPQGNVDEPLALIRAARRLWFPPHHVLHHVLPGPRAGLETLTYDDMRDFASRGLYWEESRVGIVGPEEARSGVDSVSAAFDGVSQHACPLPRERQAARVLVNASRTCVADTPMTRGAVVLAAPSVSCQDSSYSTLAVANALLASRLRTQLQLSDPRVLYARSFLDKTIVPGLWYVYLTTVSSELTSMVEKVYEAIASIIADGPEVGEVEAARRYLWDDISRVESPLGRAALARSVMTEVYAPLAWGDFLRRAYASVAPAQVGMAFRDRFSREQSVVVFARPSQAA